MPELLRPGVRGRRSDRRFYEHDGVDIWGSPGPWCATIRRGAVEEGASTITQQLARTVVPSARTAPWFRKLKEARLAGKIERPAPANKRSSIQ